MLKTLAVLIALPTAAISDTSVSNPVTIFCQSFADFGDNMIEMRDLGLTRAEVQINVIDKGNQRLARMLAKLADWAYANPDLGNFSAMPVAYAICTEEMK